MSWVDVCVLVAWAIIVLGRMVYQAAKLDSLAKQCGFDSKGED